MLGKHVKIVLKPTNITAQGRPTHGKIRFNIKHGTMENMKICFQPKFSLIFGGLVWPRIVTLDGFSINNSITRFPAHLLPNQSW